MPAPSAVFLSYHSPDRTDIIAIQKVLQGYGISTFLDRDNLELGLSWFEGLQNALGQARAVVVLIGPGELGVWQKREIALALDRQANLERTATQLLVVPVLLPKAQPEQAPAFLMLNNGVMLSRDISEETQAMARLAQALGATTAEASSPLTRPALCPYRGLDAFREEDAALFFGRDSFAENLLDRVLHHPVVAVVGASGSGKSSVVQAALLPRLRRRGGTSATWDAIICTPGTQPFHRLATALLPLLEPNAGVTDRLVESGKLGDYLATGGYLSSSVEKAADLQKVDRLLLVVDQFEELFTQTPSDQRDKFIAALLQATRDSKLRLIFTLRADFYGVVLGANRDLSECFEKAQVNLGPPRRDELRQMIEEPAIKAGLAFEAGLVQRILDDLTHQPGNLPLLEYALKGLWLERQGTTLTHVGYEAIGEVEGAISKQADTIFNSLSPAQQEACWRLFSRLVHVSAANEEGTDTRRRVAVYNLDAEAQTIAQRFAAPDVRLLVFSREENSGDTTVEVAHEALIRTWLRLRDWLKQERAFLLWRQGLEKDVAEWRQLNYEKDALYSGSKLLKAIQLTKGRAGDLMPVEQEFLQKSQAHEGKTGRLIKWVAGSLMTLAAVAGIVWGVLHWTTKGQVILINRKLTNLSATNPSPTVAYWSAARYVLTGELDKALAKPMSTENTSKLWHLLLEDSFSLRKGLLMAHHIELLRKQAAQLQKQPHEQGKLLGIAATAYGELASKGGEADSGLKQVLAEAQPLLKVESSYYTDILAVVATAYGKLASNSGLKQVLAEAKPILKANSYDYTRVLTAVATAYGKLASASGLKQVLAEAKPLPELSPSEYSTILEAVATAYGELASKGDEADSGLKQVLAEAQSILKANPSCTTCYPRILATVATAYGKLASKGGEVDSGLKQVLAEAQPFLKTQSYGYTRILQAVATAYGELASKEGEADSGLQQVLAEAKPLLKTQSYGYISILGAVATAYGELANKGGEADSGLKQVLTEAKPLLKTDSSEYTRMLETSILSSYLRFKTDSGIVAHSDLHQISEDVKALLEKDKDNRLQTLRTRFAQVLAKHKQFAQAHSIVDKMPPDDLAQALYLILERYYRPDSKPSALSRKQ